MPKTSIGSGTNLGGGNDRKPGNLSATPPRVLSDSERLTRVISMYAQSPTVWVGIVLIYIAFFKK